MTEEKKKVNPRFVLNDVRYGWGKIYQSTWFGVFKVTIEIPPNVNKN